MQLQLAAGNEHDHAIRHCRHAATRRDDGMIYTVASTLTKAAVGGLSHRPGKLVTPVKHPRLRHSSAGAAPASERAQLPAERSEERRLLLAGQRACAGPKACGGTIVTRPSFGALASSVPTSGLTRNRPDSVIGASRVWFLRSGDEIESRGALGTAARLPKMALLRAFPMRLAVPQVRRDSRTTAPSRTPSPRRSLRPADRTNAAIAHLRRPPNAKAAL